MTTISNIYNRFNKIEDMSERLDTMHEALMKQTTIGGFNRISQQKEKLETRIKNAVRKLAADLNYSVELTDRADMQSYANAFCDLRSAWSCAMESLYIRSSNYITPTI